jgi:hypothetical protein
MTGTSALLEKNKFNIQPDQKLPEDNMKSRNLMIGDKAD